MSKTRIAVIGTGMVGSSFAYAAMLKGLASEIILIDANEDRERGEVMDLSDALISGKMGSVSAGSLSDCQDVDVIVVTMGAPRKPGETRLDLANKNTKIMKEVIRGMGKLRQDTVVIVVSNPIDILTQVAVENIDLPKGQVFGSGTFLDTSRLRQHLSKKIGINLRNIHAYVLGEHGDSAFIPWSTASIAGVPATTIFSEEEMCEAEKKTKGAGGEIIQLKHSTYYGIAAVMTRIVDIVLKDKKQVVPVSTDPDVYGITGVSLGVPAIIGRRGVEKVWKLDLTDDEKVKLENSANVLKGVLGGIQ